MGCDQRVWDNGDMTDCGKPVVGSSSVCAECAAHRISFYEEKIAEAEQVAASNRAKLEDLKSKMVK